MEKTPEQKQQKKRGKPLIDLRLIPALQNHPTWEFLNPTEHRISKSVAWEARCRHCGQVSLVGASQVIAKKHTRCKLCQSK